MEIKALVPAERFYGSIKFLFSMKGIVDNRPAHHQIAGIGGNQPNKGRRVRE
jgi:hypothetical protein